jgi:aspartate/methionine/tyrosine aminotransferase
VKPRDFELERYFARWEFDAPYLLCCSDIEGYRLDTLLEMADQEASNLWANLTLGYTESQGHPLLRKEIASLYGSVDPDGLLTFAGAEEAVFALMNVLLEPGDHAIVLWPAYQSLYEVARSLGADLTLLPLEHANGWALDLDALQSSIRPTTRLVVVNFPHNPTGYLPDPTVFSRLIQIVEESGAYLFSDEVYRLLEHDPADRLPAAVDSSPRAVSLGVMSKAFGLAGLRIGWLATHDRDLLQRLAAFKDYTSICNSAPSEILALIALRAREPVLARSLEIVSGNLLQLDRFFSQWSHLFEWVRPRAGCTGFPRLLSGVPVDQFARELVEKQGVLLLPGSVYDHPGNHFRLGFGRTNFPDALSRLGRFCEAREAHRDSLTRR